ncbi:MAG TPA: glutamate--tRNA ligase, partial [Firmicutes bacterium]|nr:glutamate--tRNA ligase [Bacillota bacterium]
GQEIVDQLNNIFNDDFNLTLEEKELIEKSRKSNLFNVVAQRIKNLDSINQDSIKLMFKDTQKELSLKGKDFFMPIRIALTHQEHGIELYNIIDILGKDECYKRLIAYDNY